MLLFLALLAIVGYANVVQGPFLFDDEHFIVKNRTVQDFDLRRIYTTSVTEGASIAGNFYRPNQQVVFALLYRPFALNSAPYHVASIVLHATNAFLVFLLLTRLSFSRVAGLLAAALFLIHPVQTEAVSYISGLADPLSLLFMLLTLLCLTWSLQTTRSSLRVWSGVLCGIGTILALLAKENAVILFPLALLIALYVMSSGGWSADTRKRAIAPLLWIALPVVVYVCLRFTVLRFSQSIGLTDEHNIYTDNLHVRLITFVNILVEYARLIVFPRDLFYEKPYTAYVTLASGRALFGILWLLLWVYSALRFNARRNLSLGLSWFFVAILPFTGIVPLNAMYLEHWLYVPLIGICVLVAAVYERLANARAKNRMLLLCAVLLLLCTVRTIARNREWADVEKFYLNELEYSSASVRILNNLGMYYADRGQHEKAIEFYGRSIAAFDAFAQPHHNLARLYFRLGRHDEAVEELYRALTIDPGFVHSLHRLHQFYRESGQEERAQRVERVLENIQRGIMPSREEIAAIRAPAATAGRP